MTLTLNLAKAQRVTSAALVTGIAFVLVAGCRGIDTTQPGVAPRDSSEVASVEISFGRDIGNGLSMYDTITVVAVVRDYRGNPLTSTPMSWGISLDKPLVSGEGIATVVATGSRSALLTMNDEQAVVVAAAMRADTPNPVVAKFPVTAARRWQGFVWSRASGFTRIPTPAGYDVSPRAINDRGDVVGTVHSSENGDHAFIWTEAQGFMLIDGPGGWVSNANAINASGEVTGRISDGMKTRAYVWTRESGIQFLSRSSNNAFSSTEGTAINASGQVAAHVMDGNDILGLRWVPPSSLSSLPIESLTNPHSSVVAINDAGDILGYDGHWDMDSWPSRLERRTPVLWTSKGERIDIANCSRQCDMSVAALNNRGQIAGYIRGNSFRRSAAGEIENIALTSYNIPRGMNDLGDIVGNEVLSGSMWLWTASGEIVQLGRPAATVLAAYASGINNKGQVVGNFR